MRLFPFSTTLAQNLRLLVLFNEKNNAKKKRRRWSHKKCIFRGLKPTYFCPKSFGAAIFLTLKKPLSRQKKEPLSETEARSTGFSKFVLRFFSLKFSFLTPSVNRIFPCKLDISCLLLFSLFYLIDDNFSMFCCCFFLHFFIFKKIYISSTLTKTLCSVVPIPAGAAVTQPLPHTTNPLENTISYLSLASQVGASVSYPNPAAAYVSGDALEQKQKNRVFLSSRVFKAVFCLCVCAKVASVFCPHLFLFVF